MKIHFVGIGGIGISALSRYYLARGWQVSGSDLSRSELTDNLKNIGIEIHIGEHNAMSLAEDTNIVVYSIAVEKNNLELQKARKLNIKTQTYPQALGEIVKKHFTIAVCGAHGKGTTTALISLIMIKAGLDPSVIIGTNLKEFDNTNCRIGKSEYLVVEADEYKKAFLNYWPKIIVNTNIDKEHLDCYQDIDEISQTFIEFFNHLPENGTLILNNDNQYTLWLKNGVKNSKYAVQTYSTAQIEIKEIRKILQIPGKHNVSNALAALAVARSISIPDKISYQAMSEFNGAWRRMEIIQQRPFVLISDYAHHPTEVRATLQGIKEKFPKQKIIVVFQPHQYKRTFYLFNEFVNAFNDADEIILSKIYSVAGRESKKIMEKVNAEKLAQEIKKTGKKVFFIKEMSDIPQFVKKTVQPNNIVVVMGAGDIYKITKELSFELN